MTITAKMIELAEQEVARTLERFDARPVPQNLDLHIVALRRLAELKQFAEAMP